MSEGLVSFFKYKSLGFYKVGDTYHEDLNMTAMLDSLLEWHRTRSSIADTLLWDDETPGYSNRKKVYLKAIDKNESTGDFIVILWRAVGSGTGVYGIRSDVSLAQAEVVNADDSIGNNQVIWGEPAYYWFIPSLNIFASLKFNSSIADTELMNHYLKDFVLLHSNFKQKTKEIREGKHGQYTSVSFKSETGQKLWFRIYSAQYTKLTEEADLDLIASEITHFVKREVISAQTQQNTDWTRYFRNLPFLSQSITKHSRKVEITIDAAPTVEELRDIFDSYGEQYSHTGDNWTNLGFKKEGVGGVCWLNEFIVKNTLLVSDISQSDDSGFYSTERLFNALHLKRDSLLAPFTQKSHRTAMVAND